MHFLLDCPRYDTQRMDWLRRVLENFRRQGMTDEDIENRFRALRWLAQHKTFKLMAQFLINNYFN